MSDSAPYPLPNRVLITVYDPATGRVEGVGLCPREALDSAYPGKALLLDVQLDGADTYVDPETGEPRERPAMTLGVDRPVIAADGADTATITGIPDGATVIVRGEAFTADGTALEYSTTQAGAHTLRVFAFPHRDAEVTVHAR